METARQFITRVIEDLALLDDLSRPPWTLRCPSISRTSSLGLDVLSTLLPAFYIRDLCAKQRQNFQTPRASRRPQAAPLRAGHGGKIADLERPCRPCGLNSDPA